MPCRISFTPLLVCTQYVTSLNVSCESDALPAASRSSADELEPRLIVFVIFALVPCVWSSTSRAAVAAEDSMSSRASGSVLCTRASRYAGSECVRREGVLLKRFATYEHIFGHSFSFVTQNGCSDPIFNPWYPWRVAPSSRSTQGRA
jgi:hypothetical protein